RGHGGAAARNQEWPQRLETYRLRWSVPAHRPPPLFLQALRARCQARRVVGGDQGRCRCGHAGPRIGGSTTRRHLSEGRIGTFQMRRTLAAAIVLLAAPSAHAGDRPRGFVDAKTFIPDLIVEMRYTMAHNFVGKPIPGYKAPRCLLTRPAAQALQCAADSLRPRGYTLKVYDCYRPQTAVNAFVSWGRDLRDQKTKPEFYPEVDKRRLFVEGYIASRSGHSRGSTVDVTL